MRNTIGRYLKGDIFNKGYFSASAPDLVNFKYGKDNCPVCKETKSKFIIPPFGEYSKICLDCLLITDIKFSHDSEHGPVISENLPPDFLEEIGDIKKHINENYIKELLRTPEFSNIQGCRWMIHCNDFMIFRGIWEPIDFTENSTDRNGKKLFIEMTDKDYIHLWDDCELAENEQEYSWEDVQYYAFECRHCGKLRGYWDCS